VRPSAGHSQRIAQVNGASARLDETTQQNAGSDRESF
jgi:hypothetical protein